MPGYEKTPASVAPSDREGSFSYDKILAFFNKGHNDQTATGKANRSNVNFKSHVGYQSTVDQMSSGIHATAAGTDLANIFFPFETIIGSGNMPSFSSNVKASGLPQASGNWPSLNNLLPFKWDARASGYLNLYHGQASGDSYNDVLSGDIASPNIRRYRDISRIKSVGVRLPQIGVGWGFDDEARPWPSGSSVGGNYKFKGDFNNGWEVDPWQYSSAPLDIRYDKRRNIWGAPNGMWAKIVGSGTVSSTTAYSWIEVRTSTSGAFSTNFSSFPARTGNINNNPAFEVNQAETPSGSIVWLLPPDRTDYRLFQYATPGEGSTESIGSYQSQVRCMISQLQAGWRFSFFGNWVEG